MRLVPEPRPFDVRRPFAVAQVADCPHEVLPVLAAARRGGEAAERLDRIGCFGHVVEHALRGRRSDARQQMQDTEASDPIARVLDEAQQRQHVLDVRGIQKFQPAEFHERNVAAGQFDLERAAVRGGAEQHGLLLEQRSFLAVGQHALDDVARLVGFIAHCDQPRLRFRCALGPEVLGEAFPGEVDHAVGGDKDRLRRAVVAVERDDFRARGKLVGKVQDVAHGRGAKRIDRLRVVADDRQPAPAGFQRKQDRRLQAVGVLIFVDQHMIEPSADVIGDRGLRHHLRPVEQQVVVIEHVLLLLGFDIGWRTIPSARSPIPSTTERTGRSPAQASASALTQRE